jgi:hypothetical protein
MFIIKATMTNAKLPSNRSEFDMARYHVKQQSGGRAERAAI